MLLDLFKIILCLSTTFLTIQDVLFVEANNNKGNKVYEWRGCRFGLEYSPDGCNICSCNMNFYLCSKMICLQGNLPYIANVPGIHRNLSYHPRRRQRRCPPNKRCRMKHWGKIKSPKRRKLSKHAKENKSKKIGKKPKKSKPSKNINTSRKKSKPVVKNSKKVFRPLIHPKYIERAKEPIKSIVQPTTTQKSIEDPKNLAPEKLLNTTNGTQKNIDNSKVSPEKPVNPTQKSIETSKGTTAAKSTDAKKTTKISIQTIKPISPEKSPDLSKTTKKSI